VHRTRGQYRLKGLISDLEERQQKCTPTKPLLDPADLPRHRCDPAHEGGEKIIQELTRLRES
jgi:hypothetical protein